MSHLEIFDDWDLEWIEPDDADEPLVADMSVGEEEELSGHEAAASA